MVNAVFPIIMMKFLHRSFTERLGILSDTLRNIDDEEDLVKIENIHGNDEIGSLMSSYNKMAEKINTLIQIVYKNKIKEQEMTVARQRAELLALRSQINPHFLYNTLEAVRMKAICNGDREVGKMLYSMAVTFRAQIKEADVITLAQELHYCKKYMELFEFRYQNQFRSEIECQEEYLQVPVIKFVLQPVVENYFIHGMRMKEQDNFIRISVEKKDSFQIIMEDNGKGMPNDDIAAKNRELEHDAMVKQSSIGIANVNRRLKAVYGDAYGIRIGKGPQGGLRVVLRFCPDRMYLRGDKPGKENYGNEKGNDS